MISRCHKQDCAHKQISQNFEPKLDLKKITGVLSHWDFSQREIRVVFPGEASNDRVALPNLRCMLGVLVFP